MQIDYPFHVDSRGRTAATDEEEHVRDLIEQVLFTAPGERVMRPTFGSGVLQLVFAPNSDALAAVTQMTIQAALVQWLSDLIQVNAVTVQSQDATVNIQVDYTLRSDQSRQVASFSRSV